MATYLHAAADGSGISFTKLASYYGSPSGRLHVLTSEAPSQIMLRAAYTVDNGYVRVLSNAVDGNSTLRFRDDGASVGPTVTITGDTTGEFSNSSSASIATGSLCNWLLSVPDSSGHSDSVSISIVSFSLAASGDNPTLITSGPNGSTRASETEYYTPIGGVGPGGSAESGQQYLIRYGADFSNLSVQVTVNDITGNSTATLRDDGASTALATTITGSTTGRFENTANTVTVATGSDICYALTGGTSSMSNHAVSVAAFSMLSTGTGRTTGAATSEGNSYNPGGTYYTPVEGVCIDVLGSTTEANVQLPTPFAFTATNGFLLSDSNDTTGGNTVVALRVNGVSSAISMTVPFGTTGEWEDADTVSVSVNDDVNWIITVATGGSLGTRFKCMGFELQQSVLATKSKPLFQKHTAYRWPRRYAA